MASTIKDVARLAGVSISTVSRVANNASNVSPPIRKKVLRAIKALNYTPNIVARSLEARSLKNIAVVMGAPWTRLSLIQIFSLSCRASHPRWSSKSTVLFYLRI